MIANIVTGTDGDPVDGNGKKLTPSSYNPSEDVKKLFARVQKDYSIAWRLQHRSFDEFDGVSLLQRARLDQQTFAAYVGAVIEPISKQWRWKGRKNTSRNKIIGILAHMISGMLFPYAQAYNENNEEDEMTAKVMRILVEDYLKKADYEIKFLYMVTSALVNPAVLVEVEYVEAMQRIKEKVSNGKFKVTEAVDMLLSGIGINIIPIDQLLLADFYTQDIQKQPNISRVRRISYDEAREIYARKYFVDGKDQFDFVQAGMTRILLAGNENQTLFDVEWTEADQNYVQELTLYYRPEDLEVTFVGGVFMGNDDDVYNSNPFKHRRMSLLGDEWKTIPVYPFAKSGFEPMDPAGRFTYFKSAAFKEFWDDAGLNRMHQLAYDGTYLDVIKPMFLTGVTKIDQTVMVPGATIAMPVGANALPYSLGPNLIAAMTMMRSEQQDLSESTQDVLQSGIAQKGVTATASLRAEQNAKVIMQVFAVMTADLVRQVGELVMDDILLHTTVGEIDATIPEALKMNYRTVLAKGTEKGKDITNKIEFDTSLMGIDISKKKANDLEWDMYEQSGGEKAKQVWYRVNPYKFARTKFSLYIDPDMIISRSMGTDQLRKERAFNLLTDPRVAPFVNQEAVIDKFVLEEYSDGNPDEFKKTPEQVNNDMLNNVMGQEGQIGSTPQPLPNIQ